MKALSNIRGVGISGLEISLSWGKNRPLLTELFRELDRASHDAGVRLIIAIDEAQRLGGPLGIEVWDAIAHAYDFLDNLDSYYLALKWVH